MAMGLGALIEARGGWVNPCDRESNYFCLRVVDASHEAPFGKAKALILDHLLHSVNHESEPTMLLSPYVHLMDELVLDHFGEEAASDWITFCRGRCVYPAPGYSSVKPGRQSDRC